MTIRTLHCQDLIKRKVQIFEREFNAPPNEVFDQFCPSREDDWINGWTVDLLYTKTGYAGPLCVFRTAASNVLGPGLWMITSLEPSTNIEAVVLQDDKGIIEFLKIHLIDNEDGACKDIWEITLTATNENGNSIIESIPNEEPAFLSELE